MWSNLGWNYSPAAQQKSQTLKAKAGFHTGFNPFFLLFLQHLKIFSLNEGFGSFMTGGNVAHTPQATGKEQNQETRLPAAPSENLGGNRTSQITENWSQPTKWLQRVKLVRARSWSGQGKASRVGRCGRGVLLSGHHFNKGSMKLTAVINMKHAHPYTTEWASVMGRAAGILSFRLIAQVAPPRCCCWFLHYSLNKISKDGLVTCGALGCVCASALLKMSRFAWDKTVILVLMRQNARVCYYGVKSQHQPTEETWSSHLQRFPLIRGIIKLRNSIISFSRSSSAFIGAIGIK